MPESHIVFMEIQKGILYQETSSQKLLKKLLENLNQSVLYYFWESNNEI